jgi:hypothetical protein
MGFAALWGAAMPISQYVDSGEFEPEALVVLSAAFDDALQEIEYQASSMLRAVIAERIIAAARDGERNPDRLKAAGLAGMPREEE